MVTDTTLLVGLTSERNAVSERAVLREMNDVIDDHHAMAPDAVATDKGKA